MAKPGRGGGRPPKPKGKKKEPATIRPDDVYEAEDSDPDELRHAARYDVSSRAGGVPMASARRRCICQYPATLPWRDRRRRHRRRQPCARCPMSLLPSLLGRFSDCSKWRTTSTRCPPTLRMKILTTRWPLQVPPELLGTSRRWGLSVVCAGPGAAACPASCRGAEFSGGDSCGCLQRRTRSCLGTCLTTSRPPAARPAAAATAMKTC